MVTNGPWTWQLKEGAPCLIPPLRSGGPSLRFFGRGAPELAAAAMHQVHGAAVADAPPDRSSPTCDGLFTRRPGLLLRIQTADCLPVVLWSEGALAVCHAGWRGLAAGVLEAGASRFEDPARVRAWIGPAIGPCCYEVGPEVADHFPRSLVFPQDGKPRVHLSREAVHRLRAAGVESIDASGVCTRCHQHLLFSHRGSGGPGRNLTYAGLPSG